MKRVHYEVSWENNEGGLMEPDICTNLRQARRFARSTNNPEIARVTVEDVPLRPKPKAAR